MAGEPTAVPAPQGPSSPSGRTRSRKGAATRQRLIDAAWDVLSETPYDDARIIDITAQAGLATGTFYTYFDSKEALFRVIATQALQELADSPQRDPDNTDGDPVRDIAHASRQFFHACFRRRVLLHSIERAHTQDEEVHLARRSALISHAKRAERWIVRLQHKGICDPAIDPWYTAIALHAMTVTLGYEQLVHQDDIQKVDSLVDAVTAIWARAVGLDARGQDL